MHHGFCEHVRQRKGHQVAFFNAKRVDYPAHMLSVTRHRCLDGDDQVHLLEWPEEPLHHQAQ